MKGSEMTSYSPKEKDAKRDNSSDFNIDFGVGGKIYFIIFYNVKVKYISSTFFQLLCLFVNRIWELLNASYNHHSCYTIFCL